METLPALHFPMVIPIFHKGKSSVLRAIQQMYVLLKKHDFPLFRIHTDRGREFVNKELRSYLLARDVYHTSTPADLPQANGLVERFIGILKSQARSVLYQSGMGENHWPSALRHVASQRFETSLSSLGAKPRKFLPFGSKVVVQARSWNHKTWLPRGMDAQVLCPADGVSKGWLVLAKGKSGAPSFMITTLCYSNLKQPHLPDIQQSRTEPAAELPHVKSKADGSKVDLPEVLSDPPLPPPAIAPIDPESPVPVTKRRLTGKTSLRTAQGGVHEGFKVNVEGLNVSSLDPPPESAAESSRPFEGQRSGEFVGDGVVEGGVSGKSWDRVSRECRVYFAEKHRVSRQGVPESVRDPAEDLAREMYEQPDYVRREQVDKAIKAFPWPKPLQQRKVQREGLGVSVNFGAYTHGGCHGITRATRRRPFLAQLLNRYAKQVAPQAEYSALAISRGVQLGWHRDRHNLVDSLNWVIPIGVFEGGEIRVLQEGQSQDEADLSEHRGFKLDVSTTPVSFDARRRHCVLPSQGERLVLVGYTPRGFSRLQKEDLDGLKDLGFPLPQVPPYALNALFPQADADSSSDDGSEGSGLSSGESELGSQLIGEGVNHPLCAFCMSAEDHDAVAVQALFLSRVVREERLDVLEELKISSSKSLESLRGLRDLESELTRVELELELSDAASAFFNCDGPSVDAARPTRAKLMALGVHKDCCEQRESAFQGIGVRELKVLEDQEESPEGIWYQTQTVDPQEAASEIEKWVPALTEEYVGLTSQYKAITPIKKPDFSQEDVDKGLIEVLPSKVVYTRKPPHGQRRARIVACGNFQKGHPLEQEVQQPQSLSRFHLYASGLDSVALRVQLRMSAMELWDGAIVDVRKAFLYAPLKGNMSSDRMIVLNPPKVLVRTGIIPAEERWQVEKAVYGLEISPSCWSRHRDKTMTTITWEDRGFKLVLKALKSEPSLWRIVQLEGTSAEGVPAKETTVGLIGVYVDDLLITCLRCLLKGAIGAFAAVWQLSTPKFLSDGASFLGVDIKQADGRYFLSQESYIQELLQRYSNVTGTTLVPFPLKDEASESSSSRTGLSQEEDTTESSDKLQDIRRAQGLVGALTWVATKSRIDLAYGVNKAAQLTAASPKRAIAACEHMVRYLRATPSYGLVYGPVPQHGFMAAMDKGLLEAASDASFAPEGQRSQSGVTLQWAAGTIAWFTSRQSFITVSTAEAELYSMSEANLLLASISPLIEELVGVVRNVSYNDSVAAVSIVRQPSGPWRTRHLRLRASHLREQIEGEKLTVFHMSGKDMVADSLTKALPKQRLDHLFSLLGFGDRSKLIACSVLFCTFQPASAQGGARVEGLQGFWFWVSVAFMAGMLFAVLLQRLPRLWFWVRGWFGRRQVLQAGELQADQLGELQVFRYADDLAVLGPSPEGLRRRREGASSLQDAPTYSEEEISQIFDVWYAQNMEHYDPYDPGLDISPSLRNDAVQNTNSPGSEISSLGSSGLASAPSGPLGLISAPPVTSFSRDLGSSASSSGSMPVAKPQGRPLTLQSSGSVLRLIPNTLTPEDWEYWSERTLIGHIPTSRNRDEWELREEEGVLIRWHGKFRGQFFDPRVTAPPVPLQQFVGVRRTWCTFRDGHQSIFISGDFRTDPNTAPADGYQWRGRSEFLLYTSFNPTIPEVIPPKPAPAKNRPAKHPPKALSVGQGSSSPEKRYS